jgi:type I restriction enzyme M protein
VDIAVDTTAIDTTIHEHPEFQAFEAAMNDQFTEWRDRTSTTLKMLDTGLHPKQIMSLLSEDLLAHYGTTPLIDPYDIYQRFMDYWAETMQDDLYLVAADGWKAEASRILVADKKTGKQRDKGWTCDLVPKSLIVDHYYAADQAAIEESVAQLELTSTTLTELEEENGGDEGPFAELDTVNRVSVQARLKEVAESDGVDPDARVLTEWLRLNGIEAALKKRVRDAESTLDGKAYSLYSSLADAAVKTLVVDEKWLSTLDGLIRDEVDRIVRRLTRRVADLAECYHRSLPGLAALTARYEAEVERDLVRMGFSWK